MSETTSLLLSIPWFAWIPILAIVLGITSGTLTKLVELSHRHAERMAMIRAGMHPDAVAHTLDPEADDACCAKPVAVPEV